MSDTPPPEPDGGWSTAAGQPKPADDSRRQWMMLLLVGLVLGAVLLWQGQQDDDTARTERVVEAVNDTGPPCCEITYEVTGSAQSASITMETPSGTSQQEVDLPLRTKSGGKMTLPFSRGDFVYLSAQNMGASGTIKCTIRGHDGEVISTVQSSGAYVIAGCDGSAQ